MNMVRAKLWVFVAWLGLSSCASAPVTPDQTRPAPSEDAASYYPLVTGWKWAYQLEKGSETILATYAVTNGSADTAIVLAGDSHLSYALLPEGIARRDGLRVSDFVLKNPIRSGASWPLEGGEARVTEVGKTVTVPAGTFENCAVVEEHRNNPERIVRTAYGSGVGPLSVEVQVHDPASGKFEVQMRAALLGITRPGEDPLGASQAARTPAR